MLLVLTNLSKKIHYLHIYIQRIDKALHNSLCTRGLILHQQGITIFQ